MWGYAVLFIGLVIFITDVYFVVVSLGFRKDQCGKCKGYLAGTTQRKNHYVGGKAGRFYKHYLYYVYVYRVNGTEYRISGSAPGTKGDMSPSVDVIYQKKYPKLAYIKKLTWPMQPNVAALLLPLWIVTVICGLLMIL